MSTATAPKLPSFRDLIRKFNSPENKMERDKIDPKLIAIDITKTPTKKSLVDRMSGQLDIGVMGLVKDKQLIQCIRGLAEYIEPSSADHVKRTVPELCAYIALQNIQTKITDPDTDLNDQRQKLVNCAYGALPYSTYTAKDQLDVLVRNMESLATQMIQQETQR